jgi:hypothetical protein
MTSINDELDREFAPAWKPQPGDKLIGIVTDLSTRDGEYGQYPIVTVRFEDGEFAAHAFHEVLQNELGRVAPKIGDHIGIKYVGKDPDKGYHRYRVRRDGEGGSFDWGRFGYPDAAPETAAASDVPADAEGLPVGGGGSDDDMPF